MSSTSFTVSSALGVPTGSYNATFAGLEKFEENVEKFGEGVLLKFKIVSGDHKGERLRGSARRMFSAKSNLYKFAKALVGRDLVSGEAFDFADHIEPRE